MRWLPCRACGQHARAQDTCHYVWVRWRLAEAQDRVVLVANEADGPIGGLNNHFDIRNIRLAHSLHHILDDPEVNHPQHDVVAPLFKPLVPLGPAAQHVHLAVIDAKCNAFSGGYCAVGVVTQAPVIQSL